MDAKNENKLQQLKKQGILVLNKMPKGWKRVHGSTTAPRGYYWANNGQPLFSKDRSGQYHKNKRFERALVKE